VLGARTNRYGDFLDIACALIGRAPDYGLHRPENRRATVVVRLRRPVAGAGGKRRFSIRAGAWYGAAIGSAIGVIAGLPPNVGEDQLKALGAAAASSGAVGLFHVAGVTPEAPDVATACGFVPPERTIRLTPDMLRQRATVCRRQAANGSMRWRWAARISRSTSSLRSSGWSAGRRVKVPFYVCTGRGIVGALAAADRVKPLEATGIRLIADTCVVVTPILPAAAGVLMTNSGKFAHYGPANTATTSSMAASPTDVASALVGRVVRDERLWQ